MPARDASARNVEDRPFALRRTAAYDFIEGVNRTREALREQGFVIATTYEATGALGRACAILGVSDADLLRRALAAHPEAGVFFPCSVSVSERGDEVVVEALDPRATLGATGEPALEALAAETRERLAKALERLPAGRRQP